MTIQEQINEELVRVSKERENRVRSGKFNASNFGKCYRAQILNRLNVPLSDPLDIKTLHIFEAGKIVHDYIQNYFSKKDIEVKVEDDNFIGYADLVQEDIVWDIKSVNPAYFFFGWKDKKKVEFSVADINALIPTKKVGNVLQVAEYALRLNKPRIGLIFFSRDLSYGVRCHEWTDLTENWRGLVEKERQTLIKLWETRDTLPGKNPRLYDGNECKYCNYNAYCNKEK
jgi:hypothetical protein